MCRTVGKISSIRKWVVKWMLVFSPFMVVNSVLSTLLYEAGQYKENGEPPIFSWKYHDSYFRLRTVIFRTFIYLTLVGFPTSEIWGRIVFAVVTTLQSPLSDSLQCFDRMRHNTIYLTDASGE